jgi:Arc/MetJ-type ribon-helix-helix transcriptional regulator
MFISRIVMKVISVRLSERELREIDRLVECGVFRSRSEAIRELIRLGMENLTYLLEAVERLFELEKVEGRIPIDLSGATEQLLKER